LELYDAILQALRDVGVQGVLGRGIRDRPPANVGMLVAPLAEQLAHVGRLVDQYGADTIWLAPGASWAMTEAGLIEPRRFADERRVRISIHMEEVPFDSEESVRRHGRRTLPYLEAIGFLGPDVLHAHCVHADEEDCAILARTGGKVAYNPV